MKVDSTQHPITASSDGCLLIAGFQDTDIDSCFCIKAYGHRYHECSCSPNLRLLLRKFA